MLASGSMVVFYNGEPQKSEYRKFKIREVTGANDVAMMREILRRRFARIKNPRIHDSQIWPKPELLIIDGGLGQVNVAREVLRGVHLDIPVVGIAKGFRRKQDRLVYDKTDEKLKRIAQSYKELLLQVRDEAHRFAVSYHRRLRSASTKLFEIRSRTK